MYSIIGAIAGFVLSGFRFIGAVIGYIVGFLIDKNQTFSKQNPRHYYRKHNSAQDFTTMLMVLTAAVMRADGKTLKVELDYVKDFFRRNLGNRFQVSHLQMLKHFLNVPNIPLEKICRDIREVTKMEDRILILHYLFGIAAADGSISNSELNVIQRIAHYLGILEHDFISVKSMFVHSVNSNYKVLGIEKSASDAEVKKAYREHVLRYHPDRVVHLGEEHQKGAKEQFQKIQEAYENIKKERGMT